MKHYKTIAALLLAGALIIPLSACERDDPLEEAGEDIEDAVEEAGDEVEDATDGG